MAKKKNKNKKQQPPQGKGKPKRKRMSVSQIIFYALGIVVIISMLASTAITAF